MLAALSAATLAAAALGAGAAVPTLAASSASTSNPSSTCTNDTFFDFESGQVVTLPNGGVSHGGCVSTDAKYGYADLPNDPVLSQAALESTCKMLPQQFLEMVPQDPAAYPITLGTQTFYDPNSLASYIFHDIFGPDPSTCTAILAADHATIANPGPYGPYDVYYTGGHGANTTYAPGVPPDLAALFGAP